MSVDRLNVVPYQFSNGKRNCRIQKSEKKYIENIVQSFYLRHRALFNRLSPFNTICENSSQSNLLLLFKNEMNAMARENGNRNTHRKTEPNETRGEKKKSHNKLILRRFCFSFIWICLPSRDCSSTVTTYCHASCRERSRAPDNSTRRAFITNEREFCLIFISLFVRARAHTAHTTLLLCRCSSNEKMDASNMQTVSNCNYRLINNVSLINVR